MIRVVCFLAIFFGLINCEGVGYDVAKASNYNLLATYNGSSLYSVQVDGGKPYNDPILLIDLHGSRWEIGYAYGYLLGIKAYENYYTFWASFLGGAGFFDDAMLLVIGEAIDWQWNEFLSKQCPTEYLEEIAGMGVGAKAAGVNADLSVLVPRMIVLANLPGDPPDILLLLVTEFIESNPQKRIALQPIQDKFVEMGANRPHGLRCSMMAVWGSRTADGSLLSSRNLDWNQDTGIQKFKLIAVYHPEGKIAHATLGYVGLWGALTGMSAGGITVHEANLEENIISFLGFPWLIRLRYIMENAKTIAEAKVLWENTNNTVGFNHMIASATDATGPDSHAAMVEETMAGYTAYFLDDDPREAAAVYVDPVSGKSTQIGYPLKNALYRTNHGFDPKIREHFEESQRPTSFSVARYMFTRNGLLDYEAAGVPVGELQVINITAIVGDKGIKDPYHCSGGPEGSNVLSAIYHPGVNVLYAAWENGHDSTWTPACCNTYVRFDMTRFWNSQP